MLKEASSAGYELTIISTMSAMVDTGVACHLWYSANRTGANTLVGVRNAERAAK